MPKFSTRVAILASLTSLLAIAAASQVSAQVVFSNGAPDPTNGNEMSMWIQAQPFTLAAPATLTGVHFWDLENTGAFTGSIHWLIYANAAGTPGSILSQGDAATVSHVATGVNAIGLPEFSDDFNMAGPSLGSGSFWLGLHNGPLSHQSRDGMYWERNSPNTVDGKELIAPFAGTWSTNGSGHVFNLRADAPTVPEPGSVALLAGMAVTGSAVAVKRLRRRR